MATATVVKSRSGITLATLQDVAGEMQAVMGLDPPINAGDNDADRLEEQIVEEAKEILVDDQFSPETVKVLKKLKAWAPKEATAAVIAPTEAAAPATSGPGSESREIPSAEPAAPAAAEQKPKAKAKEGKKMAAKATAAKPKAAAKPAHKPAKKPAAHKPAAAAKPKKQGVGAYAMELIKKHPDMDNATIAEKVVAKFDSNTTATTVAWYRSAMNRSK